MPSDYRICSFWSPPANPVSPDDPDDDISPPCPSFISLRRRWLAIPPFRPASRASSLVHSCAVPFWWAALPPLLAISRCFARSIEANPRSSLATLSSSRPGSSLRNFPLLGLTRAQPVQPRCHGQRGLCRKPL